MSTMRVEINMDQSFRGIVAKVAEEKGLTMPQAYRYLMERGLESKDYPLPQNLVTVDE